MIVSKTRAASIAALILSLVLAFTAATVLPGCAGNDDAAGSGTAAESSSGGDEGKQSDDENGQGAASENGLSANEDGASKTERSEPSSIGAQEEGGSSSGSESDAEEPAREPQETPAQPEVAPSSSIRVSVSVSSSSVGSPVSASVSATLPSGASALDALYACGVSADVSNSGFGAYVRSINGLAEKQHGSGSGWMYSVNGSTPMTSCNKCVLKNGDSVSWYYVT